MRFLRFTAFTASLLLAAAANGQRSFELDILAETFRFLVSTLWLCRRHPANSGRRSD